MNRPKSELLKISPWLLGLTLILVLAGAFYILESGKEAKVKPIMTPLGSGIGDEKK